jgi:hypothetical protein
LIVSPIWASAVRPNRMPDPVRPRPSSCASMANGLHRVSDPNIARRWSCRWHCDRRGHDVASGGHVPRYRPLGRCLG